MRFISNILLLAFLALAALAISTEQRPVIVSYPKGTPDRIIEEAMEAVRKAVRLSTSLPSAQPKLIIPKGGSITHEYHLIRGFAAHASDEMLDLIQSLGEGKHAPTVEEDKVVSINGNE